VGFVVALASCLAEGTHSMVNVAIGYGHCLLGLCAPRQQGIDNHCDDD
jgi:hypothetical protein